MKVQLLDTPSLIESGYRKLVGSGVSRDTSKPHLSEVLDVIEKSMGVKYNGNWDGALTMSIGFLWERVLEYVLADELGTRVGEIEQDGILMSPDGIGNDPLGEESLILEEYKCTWKSTKNEKCNPEHNWRWTKQTQSYCYGLGLNVVVFRVLHVVGHYWGSGPIDKTWRVEYTQDELEKNWEMVLRYARKEGLIK